MVAVPAASVVYGVEAAITPLSRYIPAAVRREVHERDGGVCGFVDPQGRRCSERHRLEFHHRHPFGLGGDHGPGNLGLLCKLCRAQHNLHYSDSRIMPTGLLWEAMAAAGSRRYAA